MDWFLRTMAILDQFLESKSISIGCLHFDLKLVSVKLVGLARALPTFNFGFCQSSVGVHEKSPLHSWLYLEIL